MIGKNGFILENDVEIPFIGYGTYKVKENGEKLILDALEAGYSHFDTARKYGNDWHRLSLLPLKAHQGYNPRYTAS